MMTDGQHDGEENDDALWRLLARAPRPQPVSPFFSRRVLREVLALGEFRAGAAGGISGWLAGVWLACRRQPGIGFASVLLAAALVAVGGWSLSSRHHPLAVAVADSRPALAAPEELTADVRPPEALPPDAVATSDASPASPVAAASEPVVTAQDVEVIADLDNLLSREESRLWTEDDNTARF